MDNFAEIKGLWQSHQTGHLPSVSSIRKAVDRFKAERKRNILFTVMLALVCFTIMIWVIVDYPSQLWTTRVGESMFVLCCLYLFFSRFRLLQTNTREELQSAKDFLEILQKKTREKAANTIQPLLYMLLCLAFFFYVYEMLAASVTHLILGYGVLIVFLVTMWFVYRPYRVKKQLAKVESLLNKIENLKNQAHEKV